MSDLGASDALLVVAVGDDGYWFEYDDQRTVQQIADGLGFTTRSYFIQCFKAVTGRTPTAWRAQAGQ